MANNSFDTLSGQMRVLAEYWRTKGGTISVGTVLQFADTAERLEERIRLLERQYNELIMEVANKYADETRHQLGVFATTLRYIREHEARVTGASEESGA